MSYIRSILQPNERIVMIGRLHWIIYIGMRLRCWLPASRW